MKSFAINNGDLTLDRGGYATVEGGAKVQQDLGLAVREAYGTDRFHPQWGSTMDSYLGLALDPSIPVLLEAELRRVIQNYVAIQQLQLTQDATAGRRSRYGTNEVIVRVDHVSVVQQEDGMHIEAMVATMGHQQVSVDAQVGG